MFASRTRTLLLHVKSRSFSAHRPLTAKKLKEPHEFLQINLLQDGKQPFKTVCTTTHYLCDSDSHKLANRPKTEVFSHTKPPTEVQSFVRSPTSVTTEPKSKPSDITAVEKSCDAIMSKPKEHDELLDLNPKKGSQELGLTLQTWNLDVSPFGKLKINCPLNVKIVAMNPQDYPEMNTAHISLLANKNWEDISLVELSRPALVNRCKHIYNAAVDMKDGNIDFDASLSEGQESDVKLSCIFYLPIKFSADVTVTGNANVDVSGLETTDMKINVENGNCVLKKLKATNLNVMNKHGDIICPNVLYSNVNMTASHGDVRIGKIQSSTASINVGVGNLSLKTIYSEQAEYTLLNGNLHIGNCHGSTKFDLACGKAKIDSLDGDLIGHCKAGEIDVHTSRHNTVSVTSDLGNINLSVDYGTQSAIDLEGKKVTISPKLEISDKQSHVDGEKMVVKGVLKAAGSILTATAKDGNIHLDTKDWFNTLNLNMS